MLTGMSEESVGPLSFRETAEEAPSGRDASRVAVNQPGEGRLSFRDRCLSVITFWVASISDAKWSQLTLVPDLLQ